MLFGWVKLGFEMIDDIVGNADFSLPTEKPSFLETNPRAQEWFDRPQGRRAAPAKESIPRIVSNPE